ncbi:SGNH/GDSL hydrolase family protein [Azospirillum canadense]|uniref:SGNH/GDSL hydrolase family protein n=1 Tax=Azospirillum canadense TaxID=403962 RepID=UPI002227BE33|nr:SGNH/GDSL hydrolase family protein [Azospirillum canadense]MCW2239626.1 lysophospholipase L1-like esterase [Azospirillum canadense]
MIIGPLVPCLVILLLARAAAGAPGGGSPGCDVPDQDVTLGAPLPHVAQRLAKDEPLRIVAIGSSSTAGAGASDPVHTYPARLAGYLHQRLPRSPTVVLNKGINGQIASEMVERFQRDVLDEKPDLVIWQVGANAVLRDIDLTVNEVVIRRGAQRLKAAGLDVVLMDLQYTPAILERAHYEEMEQRLARIAADEGVGLFRRFAMMHTLLQQRQVSMSDLVGSDRVHQTDFGYDCIARTLARAILDAADMVASDRRNDHP